MPLAAHAPTHSQALGIYRIVGRNDEATTASRYGAPLLGALHDIYKQSAFWQSKLKFAEAREHLDLTASLNEGWNGYGAEAPSGLARQITAQVLGSLEQVLLPPDHLRPSAEGGIGLSFVNRDKRAVIEIYNSGEVAAATYSNEGAPEIWELEASQDQILDTIARIRVYLTA
ncbi:MAG: hypothetical protein JO138_13835 [Acidobacteriaceae bacterium]|nr:hypothetical protein [Acidobacteriaceae bacterium]